MAAWLRCLAALLVSANTVAGFRIGAKRGEKEDTTLVAGYPVLDNQVGLVVNEAKDVEAAHLAPNATLFQLKSAMLPRAAGEEHVLMPDEADTSSSTPVAEAALVDKTGVAVGSTVKPQSIDVIWLQKVLGFGLLVGGVFGMMGAGGSMILKPVLYYGFDVQPFRIAIFHGYVILMVLAAAAALKGHTRGLVCWRMVGILLCAMGFGSMLGSFQASLVSNTAQVWCFANVLLIVAGHMVFKTLGGGAGAAGGSGGNLDTNNFKEPVSMAHNFTLTPKAICMGMGAGLLSGFMGMGGGFLLVPVIRELGLDMGEAVPTAQAVVSLSASLGFCYYMLFMGCTVQMLDGAVTASLILTGLLGIAVSGAVASKLPDTLRQRTFAGMLATIAVGMMVAQP